MRAARPYGEKIRSVCELVAPIRTTNTRFAKSAPRSKNIGVIMVTSDQGLCGGLNTNAMRLVVNKGQGSGKLTGAKLQVPPFGNKALASYSLWCR